MKIPSRKLKSTLRCRTPMTKIITVEDIQNTLDQFAPPSLAEDWDNVGLQVGTHKAKVRAVLCSLDITEAVLWEAVEYGANLIISHHPLFMKTVRVLTDDYLSSKLARLAVQLDLNILSYHTNLDSCVGGLNDDLASRLKLTQIKPLLPSKNPKFPKAGLGRIGKIKKITLEKLIQNISKKLRIKDLRYTGRLMQPIQKVAIVTGSGASLCREAHLAGADALITGDVKYHNALDSTAYGLGLIDIGHFAGEIAATDILSQRLLAWTQTKKLKIKIHQAKSQSNPIQSHT